MFEGRLLAIAVTDSAGQSMRAVEEIEAVDGKGLRSDRYFELKGAFQRGAIVPNQEVTLIESEAIAAAKTDYGIQIEHLATRRNLLTKGVPLNHLVGRRFTIGEVVLEGVELCEPCDYLEKLTACEGIKNALLHRGGLRARIITGGPLRPGACIAPQ